MPLRQPDPSTQSPDASPGQGSVAGAAVAGSGAASAGGSVAGAPAIGSAGGSVAGAPAITGAGQVPRPGGREQFAADELAIVLSHFDIGIIESIVEYPRGSRKSPKLLIVSEQGKFLLKRRARGKDDVYKVAFSHAVQLYLASKQFPLPHLIGTKNDNNSMLQWRNLVYELFEYIPGQPYPQTLEATFDGGRVLSLYHKLLHDFRSEWQPSGGSYHMAQSVENGLQSLPGRLPPGEAQVAPVANFLLDSYRHAAQTASALGLDNWPNQIVHADWHPGNMLFRDNRVVAVIDYDAARLQPRIIDAANGALQFSIIGGDVEDVSTWPEYIDESRFKRFLRGYDEVMLLSEAEVRTIPWLMIEALIAEAVFPIAATGQFGRMDGFSFLQMVQRKVYWMQRSADRLVELAIS
ncbi:MAG TPA: phosphotransferase [Tepidisphaeraceae bacterium]|nr:phosphotransferase [Tepidisphaeraceae bacterium]